MDNRRRYDTESLVIQLRAERRTGIALSVGGILVLGFLVLLYADVFGDDDPIQNAPKAPTAQKAVDKQTPITAVANSAPKPVQVQGAEPVKSDPPKQVKAAVTPPPPPPESPRPTHVRVTLSKKGILWVNKNKLGRIKKRTLSLPPGVHVIKVKMGRRVLKKKLQLKAGDNIGLFFDAKKKRVVLKTP